MFSVKLELKPSTYRSKQNASYLIMYKSHVHIHIHVEIPLPYTCTVHRIEITTNFNFLSMYKVYSLLQFHKSIIILQTQFHIIIIHVHTSSHMPIHSNSTYTDTSSHMPYVEKLQFILQVTCPYVENTYTCTYHT